MIFFTKSKIVNMLCAQFLELDKSGIHVAEYLTVLPPKEILKEKLHKAIMEARQRVLENK